MSFKCDYCGKQVPAGQPINYVVTETRQKVYQNEIKTGKMRGTLEDSTGSEIVRQIKTCPKCYKELTGMEPRIIIPVAAVSKTSKVHPNPRSKKTWHNPQQKPSTATGVRPPRKDQRPPRAAPIVEVVNKITLVKE